MKLTNNNKSPRIKKTLLVTGMAALAIFAIALSYYLYTGGNIGGWSPFSGMSPRTDSSDNSINYRPPTDTEINASQDAKKRNDKDTVGDQEGGSSTNTGQASSKKKVEIGVSFAGPYDENVEVRAFVPTVIEGGGICTATLMQETRRISRSSEAFIDSSTSQCRPIIIPLSEFPSRGAWNLVVTYESSTSSGKTSPTEVNL